MQNNGENFDFERSVGQEVSSISCRIRRVRDPTKRTDQQDNPQRAFQSQTQQYTDDGKRLVKIIGCKYKLLESEILDWMALFGKVLSKITEEKFEDVDDPSLEQLPPLEMAHT